MKDFQLCSYSPLCDSWVSFNFKNPVALDGLLWWCAIKTLLTHPLTLTCNYIVPPLEKVHCFVFCNLKKLEPMSVIFVIRCSDSPGFINLTLSFFTFFLIVEMMHFHTSLTDLFVNLPFCKKTVFQLIICICIKNTPYRSCERISKWG